MFSVQRARHRPVDVHSTGRCRVYAAIMVSTSFAPEPTWATMLADGVYVGGGVVLIIAIIVVLLLFFRR